MALLWYHTIVRPFFALDGSNVKAGVEVAKELIRESQPEFQDSALFLFFIGRIERLQVISLTSQKKKTSHFFLNLENIHFLFYPYAHCAKTLDDDVVQQCTFICMYNVSLLSLSIQVKCQRRIAGLREGRRIVNATGGEATLSTRGCLVSPDPA